MADVEDRLREGIGKLSIPKKSEDSADLARNIANLSPGTQENLGVLLRSISNGEALIDTDSEGRAQIEYKAAKKIFWDGSNANVIAHPKSDPDIQVKVDACLELIGYLQSEKPPAGVVLDKTKISLSPTKEYRLGHEFEKTKKILGSGNAAGDIVVVKDRKTGQEHAYKTMMISYFRKEEVRCWVDMSDTGCVPSLYLFKIENNKVTIHMEILKNAKTLRSIIDEHMEGFYESEMTRSLVKPFSLYVLDGALEAITQMHCRGWVHNDLHGGNVMVQKTASDKLGVKVLDFGLANKLEDQNGLNFRGFKADISEVLRLFSALYTGGLEFDNAWDLQHNWKSKLKEFTEWIQMSVDDRKELFCLMDAAMKVVHPADVKEYKNFVKSRLDSAIGDVQSEKNLMKKIVAVLFPEDFKPVHQHVGTDYADATGDHYNFDVADSLCYHDIHHDNTDHHRDTVDLDLEQTANQVPDEYLDLVRMTLGISLD
ncbi:uncharacterized protein LOC123541112 [Mercenaria mercenaria]|uniref:uncharacterized protein LOC123541112 n=1 Tax=Mercenaria mercenaria TaxID=6596 RepID=UPI00234F33B3|nr:uncharacterized protein LOC123541112 [Mercenaria mercenaria]XP_045182445.2 uncharacterized protein LOC123541112 [Mercenaria mercenaria]